MAQINHMTKMCQTDVPCLQSNWEWQIPEEFIWGANIFNVSGRTLVVLIDIIEKKSNNAAIKNIADDIRTDDSVGISGERQIRR